MGDPRDALFENPAAGDIRQRRARKAGKGAAVYLLTSAQNNTRVHPGLWRNLMAYAAHRGATVLVSQFTYNKGAYRDGVKPGTRQASDFDSLWYDPVIAPFVCNDRFAITPSLILCGEVNTLPTADRPLSGFANYTGRASSIFPHAKFAMESVSTPLKTPAKLMYTTGCCTLRNYLQRKAGLKAEALHGYGALIVEVMASGDWFVRQLHATDDGAFQDLDVIVAGGAVTAGNRVEALQWGDVHVAQLDPVVRAAQWGAGGIIDVLAPRYQFMHDTLDFLSRNHHSMRDPHEMFRKWAAGKESVEAELQAVAAFLTHESSRPDTKTVVVNSNHDEALMRWLRDAELRADPVNARFYLRAQRAVYDAIAGPRRHFHLLEYLLRQMGVPRGVKFLGPDDSFVLCKARGGIECGLHGHTGPNGSRGSPRALSRMGRPVNSGHTHVAGIVDECYTAGTSSLLDMGYNRGAPSGWSHTLIVTYPNGRRALLTLWGGRWRG